jgi:hypothetical protein
VPGGDAAREPEEGDRCKRVQFLQEVAGYRALQVGFAPLLSTIVMFLISKRMGRLAAASARRRVAVRTRDGSSRSAATTSTTPSEPWKRLCPGQVILAGWRSCDELGCLRPLTW